MVDGYCEKMHIAKRFTNLFLNLLLFLSLNIDFARAKLFTTFQEY